MHTRGVLPAGNLNELQRRIVSQNFPWEKCLGIAQHDNVDRTNLLDITDLLRHLGGIDGGFWRQRGGLLVWSMGGFVMGHFRGWFFGVNLILWDGPLAPDRASCQAGARATQVCLVLLLPLLEHFHSCDCVGRCAPIVPTVSAWGPTSLSRHRQQRVWSHVTVA